MAKIYSGIVLYNSELPRLLLSLDSISRQVDRVILVDNGSSNIEEICNAVTSFENVFVVKNHENLGIATALNQICSIAFRDNAEWVLTLDQDTVCPNDIIEQLCRFGNREEIGIVCPSVDYEGLNIQMRPSDGPTTCVYACMTSGSLTNVHAWKKVGGFRDDYFIDFVDNEFCMKLGQAGYKIIRINECVMHHQLGEVRERGVLCFKKKVSVHSPWRFYYMTRNNLLFIWEYKQYLNVFKEYLKLCSILIPGLLYADDKRNTYSYIKKGFLDARKGKVGRLII